RSMKSLTTGSATSASIRAKRTSPNASSTSASDSAPRPRKRSNTPPRRDCKDSNINTLHGRADPAISRQNANAPGGAPALPGVDPQPGRGPEKLEAFPDGAGFRLGGNLSQR